MGEALVQNVILRPNIPKAPHLLKFLNSLLFVVFENDILELVGLRVEE